MKAILYLDSLEWKCDSITTHLIIDTQPKSQTPVGNGPF